MVDIVLWSFTIALAPWAVLIGWKLVSGLGDQLGFGRAMDSGEVWRMQDASGSFRVAARFALLDSSTRVLRAEEGRRGRRRPVGRVG